MSCLSRLARLHPPVCARASQADVVGSPNKGENGGHREGEARRAKVGTWMVGGMSHLWMSHGRRVSGDRGASRTSPSRMTPPYSVERSAFWFFRLVVLAGSRDGAAEVTQAGRSITSRTALSASCLHGNAYVAALHVSGGGKTHTIASEVTLKPHAHHRIIRKLMLTPARRRPTRGRGR